VLVLPELLVLVLPELLVLVPAAGCSCCPPALVAGCDPPPVKLDVSVLSRAQAGAQSNDGGDA
jgi:hypothetical protein